jgi:hypothetical protein
MPRKKQLKKNKRKNQKGKPKSNCYLRANGRERGGLPPCLFSDRLPGHAFVCNLGFVICNFPFGVRGVSDGI